MPVRRQSRYLAYDNPAYAARGFSLQPQPALDAQYLVLRQADLGMRVVRKSYYVKGPPFRKGLLISGGIRVKKNKGRSDATLNYRKMGRRD